MKIIFEGDPKEIAALVLAVQERRNGGVIHVESAGKQTDAEKTELADSIRSVLLSQTVTAENQSPQSGSTERTQNQDAESHSPEPGL